MANEYKEQLHFVLFPFMAQGHLIPMADIAKLFAKQGVKVTIVTTPLNANRVDPNLSRAVETGLQIQVIGLPFPPEESGLPKGCESFDLMPSFILANKFFAATNFLQEPVERLLEELEPKPDCIISDMCLPYTARVAKKFAVPRISFNGFSSFCNFCYTSVAQSNCFEDVNSDLDPVVVPGTHVELTKNQMPLSMHYDLYEFKEQVNAAEVDSYGMVINTFEELEPAFVEGFRKFKGDDYKLWCVGPVALCNQDYLDKIHRGNRLAFDESECFEWLNSQEAASVLYVCLGSVCNLVPAQLIELGLGLESSNRPFIWIIRCGDYGNGIENWIVKNGFDERTKGRGLLIKDWAPQVEILSHKAIGGFLTHCGWNSTLEGITSGLPMITWPLFGDQFVNEKFIIQILNIGVRVGANLTMKWGEEEETGVLVKKEDVHNAIEALMSDGEESEERRRRAKELSQLAKEAVEEGGSSNLNIKLLIQDIKQKSLL